MTERAKLRKELEDNEKLCWALKLGLCKTATILSGIINIKFTLVTKNFVYVSCWTDEWFSINLQLKWDGE